MISLGRRWSAKCPQAFKAHGFASELEEWNFHMETVKHLEEVDEVVARYAASQPKWTAKLSWQKTKTGRTRGRRVGSRVTRSSLPT
eukprot:5564627-Amphidinium_carterae.1